MNTLASIRLGAEVEAAIPHAVAAGDLSGGPAFLTNSSEISENLSRLHLIAGHSVERLRRYRDSYGSGLAGLAILDEEIDRFLSAPPATSFFPNENAVRDSSEDLQRFEEQIRKDRTSCEMRAAAGAKLGVELRLHQLRERFELTPTEVDVCLMCLAPEIDPRYGRLYAYIQNDISRSRPTLSLALDLFAFDWTSRIQLRRLLAGDSTLVGLGLVAASEVRDNPLENELVLDDTVTRFLLGAPIAQILNTKLNRCCSMDELILSTAERELLGRLEDLLAKGGETEELLIAVLRGLPGVGKNSVATALITQAKERPFLFSFPERESVDFRDLGKWLRKVRVLGGTPVLDISRALPLIHDQVIGDMIRLVGALRFRSCFLLVNANTCVVSSDLDDRVRVLILDLQIPSVGLRKRAWTQFLSEEGQCCAADEIATAAALFPLTVGKIRRAAHEFALRNSGNEPVKHTGSFKLNTVCRAQTNHRLGQIADLLPANRDWKDLVLPQDEMTKLREIAGAVRNRERVIEDWHFGSKVCSGPGVNALFFGPTGTGKTLAASVLANALGMEIYRVDLSRVVSKYIGETEKNLDTLFEEARRAFAILFFDEAEALFGKRSEVKDSHDRYANIEVAYLLQRMETFEGVAILATNLRKNMDNAFVRRLQFAVEFPVPDLVHRWQIWRQVWPDAAEISKDLDLEFMARNFELAGGHIRNIAVTAAYLAAQDCQAISMQHLIMATRREFQKFGRLIIEDEFGAYKHLLLQERVA